MNAVEYPIDHKKITRDKRAGAAKLLRDNLRAAGIMDVKPSVIKRGEVFLIRLYGPPGSVELALAAIRKLKW
jgi:hypothetical protein